MKTAMSLPVLPTCRRPAHLTTFGHDKRTRQKGANGFTVH